LSRGIPNEDFGEMELGKERNYNKIYGNI